MNQQMEATLKKIARFFDDIKIGHAGNSGYRKTTELGVLLEALKHLIKKGYLCEESIFLDLGSGDGRVNFFMGYLVKYSIGIEIEDFIYEESFVRKTSLENYLKKENLPPLPSNIHLFLGDSLQESLYDTIEDRLGIAFEDIDLFYTYITLHDLFAELITQKARHNALYMVYGFSDILPRYEGLELLDPDLGGRKSISLYRKR